MEQPLLSIVMVCHDHGQYLKDALGSIREQTYPHWELIVVDDGSSDDSVQVIREYQAAMPERIRFFTHPGHQNKGISASYALGLAQCKGELVGFLEGDDIWDADCARQKVEALCASGAGLVYSAVRPIGDPVLIRKRSGYLRRSLRMPQRKPFRAGLRLLILNFIPTFSTVIFRRSLLEPQPELIAGGPFEVWLDWFLWVQLGQRTDFYFLPEALVSWRMYRKSYGTQTVCKGNRAGEVLFQLRYRLFLLRKLLSGKRNI